MASLPLSPVDLIDIGLVCHFLGTNASELWDNCIVALSFGASHSSFARHNRVLSLNQIAPQGSAPAFLELSEDHVCCLEWLQPDGASPCLLLAGCRSGALRGYSPGLSPAWVALPHNSPLVSICVHSHGPSPDMILTFEDGRHVGYATAAGLHQAVTCEGESSKWRSSRVTRVISIVALDAPPADLSVAISCGPLTELPLDLPEIPAPTDASAPPKQLALVIAGRWAQLQLVERFPCRSQKPQLVRTAPRLPAAARGLASSIAGSSTFQQLTSSKVAQGGPAALPLPPCLAWLLLSFRRLAEIVSCHADAMGSISNWWSNSAPVDQQVPDEDHAEEDEVIGEENQEAFELATMATAVRELRDPPRTFLGGALDPQRRWLALTGAAAHDSAISMLI